MTEFVTRNQTTLSFDHCDISEYLIHSDTLLEQLLIELAGPAHSKLSVAAQRRRMAEITWPWWSEQMRTDLGRDDAELFREKIAADLLEWGRGLVQCPACEVPIKAVNSLYVSGAMMDSTGESFAVPKIRWFS